MTKEDVLAVVVSYNGLGQVRETVRALLGQVGHVHIVDNGSGADSLQVLESLHQESGVSIERLGKNRGVGYALNLGVAHARAMGYAWLLTMDQDSVVDKGMIQAYQAAINNDPALLCLSPRRKDGSRRQALGGPISYAITSGNLVRVSLFSEVGLYDEGFFIDCVDFDFSLRIRRAGYGIYLVPNAVMRHQLGEPIAIPAILQQFYARHAPARRYYMYRNYLYLAERYLVKFPRFILKLGVLQVVLLPFIGILDRHPIQSFLAVARGVRDYLARREGPYTEGSS